VLDTLIPTGLRVKHTTKLPEASDNYRTFGKLVFTDERSGNADYIKGLARSYRNINLSISTACFVCNQLGCLKNMANNKKNSFILCN